MAADTPYTTLMTMLGAAPNIVSNGVQLAFGEEMIIAQDFALPFCVVVPSTGTWAPPGTPGYFKGADPGIQNIWMTAQNIDLYLWAHSVDSTGAYDQNATPAQNADATWALVTNVLQAFQNQAPYGLKFYPTNGAWVPAGNEVNRYGRAYKLTVSADFSIPDVSPVNATITNVNISATITA